MKRGHVGALLEVHAAKVVTGVFTRVPTNMLHRFVLDHCDHNSGPRARHCGQAGQCSHNGAHLWGKAARAYAVRRTLALDAGYSHDVPHTKKTQDSGAYYP